MSAPFDEANPVVGPDSIQPIQPMGYGRRVTDGVGMRNRLLELYSQFNQNNQDNVHGHTMLRRLGLAGFGDGPTESPMARATTEATEAGTPTGVAPMAFDPNAQAVMGWQQANMNPAVNQAAILLRQSQAAFAAGNVARGQAFAQMAQAAVGPAWSGSPTQYANPNYVRMPWIDNQPLTQGITPIEINYPQPVAPSYLDFNYTGGGTTGGGSAQAWANEVNPLV